MRNHKNAMVALAFLTIASVLLAACGTQVVTQIVEVTKEVEVVQTQLVEATTVVEVEAASFTKPHPLLGDIRVRQGIAYCTNRPQLIASVYPFVDAEGQQKQLMDTNIPRASWAAYDGPEIQKYPFDATKGQALFDEAGWTLAEGATYRTNADGDEMNLKFTTTTAAFRQTWAAVFEKQMAACGLRIIRLHAPASWWFGSTTGLRHRDFELGAYAWVGETDPKGQTLYACNQINVPENGWAGQNYMGWCNQVASDAINAANNTLVREERIAHYKTFQIEFAKDMVSLPVFQRAEGNAASSNLVNFKPSATEYYTWNSYEWELADGGDTLVLALSQEPASMYSLIESAAVQRTVGWMIFDSSMSQYDWDFQPAAVAELSSVENGMIQINEVEVKEGDPVVDYSGTPTDSEGNLLTLTSGLKVKTSSGEDVEFSGGTVKMNQLVATYEFQPTLTWSDGEPVKKADFELAYKNDCDPASGAVDYSTCQSIQSVDFTSDNEYTVTYKPGYMNSLSFIPPIATYPSHQVLSDGRKLADVPTTEWSGLKEIAETPLGFGPYILTNWEKGVKLELTANPFYWRGENKVKNITILIVQDTQQAVAQLLSGDVDVIGSETLGAGAEVQTVIDAQAAGDPIQVLIEPSATWEHIDMNLFVP
ncbi:MAG: peptide ABC transporter substrate-binding protein [Chloroflexi bacterium]|nr:peptide ABC transporter substrate-binding protein [Chloroflexota bacterium]